MNVKGCIMELLKSTDSLLRQKCQPFDFETGYTLSDGTHLTAIELFEVLRDTMCANRGIGLSASQLGIMTCAFVIGNPSDPSSVISIFNPSIVDASDSVEVYEEGCLSFPGLFLKVKRPITIRVRYTNYSGSTDTIQFDGLTARGFQHEYDHMNGILFTNRANPYHIDLARRQLKKLNKLRNNKLNKLSKAITTA